MKRRHLIYLIIVAMLIPQVAGALPRPAGGKQEGAEQEIFRKTISADLTEELSPALSLNRQYKVEVFGIWKPSSGANHIADAAFEATNGSNWTKTGKGLVFGTVKMGEAGVAPLTPSGGSLHPYTFTVTGRGFAEIIRINDPSGNTDGNSGSLTVVVKDLNQVRWVYPQSQTFNSQIPGTPRVTFTADTRPYGQTMTVENQEVMTTSTVDSPVPVWAGLAFQKITCGDGQKDANLQVILGNTKVVDQFILCIGDSQAAFLGFLDGGKRLGAGTQPVTMSAVSAPCQPGVDSCEYPVGSYFIEFPVPFTGTPPMDIPFVPPGSRLEVSFGWEADMSRLWPSFFNTGQGDQYVAPFNPFDFSAALWYQNEVAANRLGLLFGLTLIGPDGNAVGGRPTTPILPGVGQILESAFATKVRGQ